MANGRNGLPNNLRTSIEHLAGTDLSNVRIRTHSAQAASVQAHAYAQGNAVHTARGGERHLPHETAHVTQQKQGRLQPTTMVNPPIQNTGRK
ncbi:eCIS core domain-containing protein [Planctobacterium marinum]|uniref:eCIS core domain-containing protein n=1 Tax=Planctobacterium marinum TaxID=1631968 RepID=UPI001E493552|nr:DUF4157 domain-containing protein [Planctobacterium marinum]MCC2607304.1 DUF4157 domain-containing protein [Planctobacterium marinum]